MMVFFEFARRFWPLFVIVPLVFAVLFMRNTISRQDGKLAVNKVEIANWREADKQNKFTIELYKQQRADNDKIAETVAALLNANGVREVNTRTIIERAIRDEPEVRDWASVPVPSSVRKALARPDAIQAGQ